MKAPSRNNKGALRKFSREAREELERVTAESDRRLARVNGKPSGARLRVLMSREGVQR